MASETSSSTSSPDIGTFSTSTFPPRDPFSPQTDHANGHTPESYTPSSFTNGHTSPLSPTTSNVPNPAPLTLRAFLLGFTLSISLFLTIHLAFVKSNPLWRIPFFLTSLSLFHYLEYQVTALYNPLAATTSAFLLSQNGRAYNIAHTLAFTECGIHWYFFPNTFEVEDVTAQSLFLGLGFAMMIVGQLVRTTAMAQAGKNFSHVVSVKKKEGHVLVTDGVYSVLRHPSYFGFFWWGLGSQLVLGNLVCLLGYAVVLWRFFSARIAKEEQSLIGFFGAEYKKYLKKTWTGIPFIY
ncbi:farnesyl cysteine-carboxyl methyltransferase [Lecanora helva]